MTDTVAPEAPTVYQIPAGNMAGLLAKLEGLSKKSQRLIGKPVELKVLEETHRPVLTNRNQPVLDDDGNPCFDIFYTVSIEAETPRIAGWTFVATIDHSATSGNLLRMVPNVTCEIPEKYRSIGPVCDHCNKIRSRRDTFLLRSDNTGELKQIGRQCIRDFIGYDIEGVVAMAELLGGASPSDSDADYDCSNVMQDRRYILVKTYLAHVAAVVRKHGWVSGKDAEIQHKYASKHDAHDNMFRKPGTGRPPWYPVPLTDKDFATADAALAWAQGLTGQSEFEHNLRVLANETMVEGRSIGFLAYIVPGFFLHTEKEFKRVQRRAALNLEASRHVGVIGAKIGTKKGCTIAPMDAVLYGYQPVNGRFGPTLIYRFRTTDGNVLVWFASGNSDTAEALDLGGIDAANRVPVRIVGGTVKKHNEYDGMKQTVLLRCKVEKVVVAPVEEETAAI